MAMTAITALQRKPISEPDEVRVVDRGRIEIVKVGDAQFSRTTFEPGWRWSESVKPIAGTASCELPHRFYVVSGSMLVRMDDGTTLELVAGDVVVVPPGHDAWVTSSEPLVGLDFGGEDEDYALPSGGSATSASSRPCLAAKRLAMARLDTPSLV